MSILDAVAGVITYDNEILIIQRQSHLKSFPGYWAFPGGKVEASDAHPRLETALKREIQEELSLDLNPTLVKRISEIGLAVTPDFNPQRFATYFYKVEVNSKPQVTPDAGEIAHVEWATCADLLKRYEAGDLLVVPPVLKVIQALAKDFNTTHHELAFHYDALTDVPMIESLKGLKQFMPLSHTLPPANRTNCFVIGDDGGVKVMIDPSPKDADEMKKLLHSVSGLGVNGIFLTHHHPDHHEHAPEIARTLKLPIFLSLDTKNRLEKLHPDYFKDIKLNIVGEGVELLRWLGHPVHVIAVPGHDEGQLALMPQNKAWFLAGDLFQGIGTVVIGGEEGDMGKYMSTLERVIKLSPKVIFPSHGIGLGSTFILEKTLEHRHLREEQMLQMHQSGKNEDEMLQALYSDIPEKLHKYARENIRAHLKKLKNDGKI